MAGFFEIPVLRSGSIRFVSPVKRAMECDFSWSNSAKSYEGLYNEVVNLW